MNACEENRAGRLIRSGMEIERHQPQNLPTSTAAIDINANGHPPAAVEPHKPIDLKRLILLLLNVILLITGGCGSPLLMRVYFLHGGNREWLTTFLQTAAFPFLLIPLIFSFLRRRSRSHSASTPPCLFLITPSLLLCSAGLGIITGIDNLLYSYGISYLPVSTSSLLLSTQLGFTAIFAFFIVRQKFTAFSINSVVLLTFGAVVLGVHANGDRPKGESKSKYYAGFGMTLGAAVVYGLVLPLVELMYTKAKQAITYTLVMEIQLVIGAAATAFCAVGMAVNKDFQAISREGHLYSLGETKYYVVIIFIAVVSQCFFLGLVGTINYSSALLGGIILAICIPITEVLAVFFFKEKFDGEKGVALALSLWGMASYFYGEYRNYRRGKAISISS